MYNLYSGDVETIEEVLEVGYLIEGDTIILTAKIKMVYDSCYIPYKIGKYNIQDGYGSIITKNGTKEYKNLKSLCKATEKFNPKSTFEYNKLINYKKTIK